MITCANHQRREADFHCSRCEAAYCKDCVNEKKFGTTRTPVCPSCNEPVTDLSPYREVPPLWSRIPQALTWPFKEDGWLTLLAWGAFAILFLGGARLAGTVGGGLALMAKGMCLTVYYGFLISYLYRIISKGEAGDFRIPEFTEYRGIGQTFIWPIIQYTLAGFIIFWPISIYLFGAFLFYVRGLGDLATLFSSPITWVILVVGGIYGYIFYPMGLLILGVGRSVKPLLNPLLVIQQVFKIPGTYFLSLGIMLIFLIIYGIAIFFFDVVKASLPQMSIIFGAVRSFIDGVLQLYQLMVFGHILGYIAYQERFRLQWWPETKEKPAFMIGGRPQYMSQSRFPAYADGRGPGGGSVSRPTASAAAGAAATAGGMAAAAAGSSTGGRPPPPPGASSNPGTNNPGSFEEDMELSRRINDGMAMLDHGRHEEAEKLFKEILDQNPNNMGALRGITLALIKQKNYPAAAEYAKKQASALLKDKAYDSAWEVYSEMAKHVKEFSLEPRDQLLLSKWLNEQQRWMDAARVLRSLAAKHPDDPLAPKALYQCGELLWKKCDKKDNALQVFQYLLKKYPDLQFADHVQQSIKELQS
ncbi:MAG: tetratricopeptide repeat protein [bacterium]